MDASNLLSHFATFREFPGLQVPSSFLKENIEKLFPWLACCLTHTHSHQKQGDKPYASYQPAPLKEQLPAGSSKTTIKSKRTPGHLAGSWGGAPPSCSWGWTESTLASQRGAVTPHHKGSRECCSSFHCSRPGSQIYYWEVANNVPWAAERDWKRPLGRQFRSLYHVVGL